MVTPGPGEVAGQSDVPMPYVRADPRTPAMTSSRRDFLQRSAAAATAVALGPAASSTAESITALERTVSSPVPNGTDTRRVVARPVPSSRVRVSGGPLKQAQDLTAKYLLELEPDRMLAYYRMRAGLPKKAEPYSGWDGGGRNLTGHIAGHYLSAVSLMYLATGDARYKSRADYVVRELKTVQDQHGDGYLSALEGGREATSGRRPSISMACGRRGTRCTRRSPDSATPTGTPETELRSASRRSSRVGPKACSDHSRTRRSRRCSTPSTAE